MSIVVFDPGIPPPEDEALIAADYQLIAENIAQVGQARHPGAPSSMQLAQAMTSIVLNGAMPATSLVVNLWDEDWAIMDSGIFDADNDGVMDAIDLNYPDGSRYWWRLTQIAPKSDHTIQLTFMVREAVYLMHHEGPIKANRASMTRAEFLEMLCDGVKEGDGIEFYSLELHQKEKIASFTQPTSTAKSGHQPKGKAAKTGGLGLNVSSLKCNGQPLTKIQAEIATTAIAVGQHLKAPTNAIVAAIYAGMGESSLGQSPGTYAGTGGTVGPWQAQPGHYNNGHDTVAQVTGFYTGGVDFQQGGAIHCANRGDDPITIANEVEANQIWNTTHTDSYAKNGANISEAIAVVAAGGGGSGSLSIPAGGSANTIQTVQSYFFQVAWKELYWTAVNRLATEVQWDFFLDGNRAYYDSDAELVKQRPAATIHRDDEAVISWDFLWDVRQVITGMNLSLVCGMFEIQVGDVLIMENFGPASIGSTAVPKLPGRWMVESFTRNKGDLFTSFVLKQPKAAKSEPAPQVSTGTLATNASAGGGSAAGGSVASGSAGVDKFIAKAIEISNQNLTYSWGGGHGAIGVPGGPSNGFDCSGYVSACAGAAGWLSTPMSSGGWGSWGDPGPGKFITIYYNADHIYAHITVPGSKITRVDTVWDSSGPGSNQGPHVRYQWPGPDGTSGFQTRHWPGA